MTTKIETLDDALLQLSVRSSVGLDTLEIPSLDEFVRLDVFTLLDTGRLGPYAVYEIASLQRRVLGDHEPVLCTSEQVMETDDAFDEDVVRSLLKHNEWDVADPKTFRKRTEDGFAMLQLQTEPEALILKLLASGRQLTFLCHPKAAYDSLIPELTESIAKVGLANTGALRDLETVEFHVLVRVESQDLDGFLSPVATVD